MRSLMSRAVAPAATVLLLAAGGTGSAQADAGGNLQAALLASSCANCHGTEGRLSGTVPRLAGQPESVIAAQLRSFREDAIPDTTIMNRIAKGYTDEEIDALARYFAYIRD